MNSRVMLLMYLVIWRETLNSCLYILCKQVVERLIILPEQLQFTSLLHVMGVETNCGNILIYGKYGKINKKSEIYIQFIQ